VPLLVGDAVMEYLPDDATQTVRHSPNGGVAIQRFKDSTPGVHRRICRLVWNAAHGAVAFGGMVTFGLFGRFFRARAGANPAHISVLPAERFGCFGVAGIVLTGRPPQAARAEQIQLAAQASGEGGQIRATGY
jgi:hypothetical protein